MNMMDECEITFL